MAKKIISLMLCLCLVISFCPAEALAANFYSVNTVNAEVAKINQVGDSLYAGKWLKGMNMSVSPGDVICMRPADIPEGKVAGNFEIKGYPTVPEIKTAIIDQKETPFINIPDNNVTVVCNLLNLLDQAVFEINEPAVGAEPDRNPALNSIDNAEITGCKWLENGTNENFRVFEEGKTYTLEIYCSVEKGSAYGEETNATVNGKTAQFIGNNSFSCEFTPKKSYKVTANNCRVALYTGQNEADLQWKDTLNVLPGSKILVDEGAFDVPAGKKINSVYATDDTSAAVDIVNTTVDHRRYSSFVTGENNITVNIKYDEIIPQMYFTVVAPVGGKNPDLTATVPEGAKYYPDKVTWYSYDTDEVLSDTDVFVAGKRYVCEIYYGCSEGYTEGSDGTETQIYINNIRDNSPIGSYTSIIFTSQNLEKALAPVITDPQSLNISGMYDREIKLSVDAKSTDGGILTYQWYENSKNSTEGGKAINGAVNKDYSFYPEKTGTFYYYCVVTNTNDNAEKTKTATAVSPVLTVAVDKLTVNDFTLMNHNLNIVSERTPGGNDGRVDYLGTYSYTLEYADNPQFKNAREVTTPSLTGLKPGIYYFRYKNTEFVNESNSDKLYIYAYAPSGQSRPVLFIADGISTDGGKFDDTISVTFKAMDNQADIYYTTDKTEPTVNSSKYTGTPIVIDKTTTLKAMAVFNDSYGFEPSEVKTASFIKRENVDITFSANGGSGSMDKLVKETGTTLTLPDSTFTPPSEKKFAGWKINGTGDLLSVGTEIEITEAVELAAQWEDKKTVSIEGVTVNDRTYNGEKYAASGNRIFKLQGNVIGEVPCTESFALKSQPDVKIEAPSDAGNYIYSLKINSPDYKGSFQKEFSINPKTLTWDVSGLYASKTEGSGDAAVYGTLSVKGLIKGDTYTAPSNPFKAEGSAELKTAGTYKDIQLSNEGGPGTVSSNYILPQTLPKIEVVVTKVSEKPQFEDPSSGKIYKSVCEEGISSVPSDVINNNSSLNTPAKVTEAMAVKLTDKGVKEENILIYDLKLQIKEGESSWRDVAASDFAGGKKITVLLPYPEGTNPSDFNFTVAHMFTTGPSAGTFEYPAVTKKSDGLSFALSGLSPVSIGWTVIPAPSSSSSSSSHEDSSIVKEEEFWGDVEDEIANADAGDVITVHAKDFSRMPWTVMENLRKAKDVTLKIKWDGKDIVIPSAYALNDPSKVYYSFKYLAQLDFSGVVNVPSNPPTGAVI